MTGWITALARAGLIFAIVLGLFAGAIPPSAVRADTNLVIGGTAHIAYANGDQVRFRTAPGSDAPVISSIAEGTVVTVLDGPVDDGSGILWYQVSIDGQAGYIAEQFLADGGGDASLPAEPDASSSVDDAPPAEPTTSNLPTGTITGTNGEGARCRIAPNPEADVIATLAEGAVVALAGERSGDWQPVICEDQAGFVAAQLMLLPGQPEPVVETPAPPVEETVVAEEPTAEPVVTQEPVAEPEVTEEPAAATEEATESSPTEDETPTASSDETATAPADESSESNATAEPTDNAATETPDATEPAASEGTESATSTPESNATEDAGASSPDATATATDVLTETPTGTPVPEPITGVTPDASPEPIARTPVLGTPVLSGTAIVVGTNGGGLQCRVGPDPNADVIVTLAERATVDTRGDAKDGWLPIVCEGEEGYAVAQFLLLDLLGSTDGTSADTGTSGSGDIGATTGSAIVSGTGGDGVRCRTRPSSTGSVITVLKEGATVALRAGSGATSNFQAVVCGGRNGFVNKKYLSAGGTVSAAETATAAGVTGSAVVSGTNGDGLRCRSAASFSASVILVLREGATVALRGAAKSGWQPVYCGKNSSSPAGFVASDYLGSVTQADKTGSTGGSTSLGKATVVTASGKGARMRAKASLSAAVVLIVPSGSTVSLRSGSTGDWTAVRYSGTNGFILSSLIKASGTTGGTTAPAGPAPTTGLKKGDRAETTANLNLRYSASYSAGVAAVAPEGTVVKITGGASSGFYPVDWDGLTGYMHGDYLVKTTKALSTRGGSGTTDGTSGGTTDGGGGGGGGGGSATGNSMVDFAMQYLGYPYVWATAGPSSFDCSGFTYWVTKNVLGMDIGRGLWTQVAAGTTVSRDALQPGDLVFFQNTYTWGLSHVGLYIGNNKFIHAENESTGVVISDLTSTYYSTRWYGAVRLG